MFLSHLRRVRVRWWACIVTLPLLAACNEAPQAPQQEMKVPVSVVEVQPRSVVIDTELPGRVHAIEDAEIRARVTGIVQSIEFEQGSEVHAGQKLFIIDPAPYEAARDQASAQLENAEAAAHSAQLQARRFGQLIKQSAISQQDYDNAIAQARQTAAAVSAAKAALESAEIDLGYTRVTSPIEGRIGKSMVTVGALVSASSATQLATVHRLDEVYVDITQPTTQLAALRRQMEEGLLQPDSQGNTRARIILENGETYEQSGKLLFSGVAVDPGTGQVSLRALFPNPDQILLPGMFVRVRLVQGVDQKALVVPEQAVQRTADGLNTLVIVKDGKASFTAVQLGPRSDLGYVVYGGLEPGDQVVVEGFQKIRPGAPVQPMPWKQNQPSPDGEAGSPGQPAPEGNNASSGSEDPDTNG